MNEDPRMHNPEWYDALKRLDVGRAAEEDEVYLCSVDLREFVPLLQRAMWRAVLESIQHVLSPLGISGTELKVAEMAFLRVLSQKGPDMTTPSWSEGIRDKEYLIRRIRRLRTVARALVLGDRDLADTSSAFENTRTELRNALRLRRALRALSELEPGDLG